MRSTDAPAATRRSSRSPSASRSARICALRSPSATIAARTETVEIGSGPELEEGGAADVGERLEERLRGLTGLDAVFCEIDCYLEGMDDPPLSSRAFFVLPPAISGAFV